MLPTQSSKEAGGSEPTGNRIPAIMLPRSAKNDIMLGFYTNNVANVQCTRPDLQVDGWHKISIKQTKINGAWTIEAFWDGERFGDQLCSNPWPNTHPKEFENIVVYYSNPNWGATTKAAESIVVRNVNVVTFADDFIPNSSRKRRRREVGDHVKPAEYEPKFSNSELRFEEDCKELCANSAGCQSYIWDTEKLNCDVYFMPLTFKYDPEIQNFNGGKLSAFCGEKYHKDIVEYTTRSISYTGKFQDLVEAIRAAEAAKPSSERVLDKWEFTNDQAKTLFYRLVLYYVIYYTTTVYISITNISFERKMIIRAGKSFEKSLLNLTYSLSIE